MQVSRLTLAVPLLLVGCALIVLAGVQLAVMVDVTTRFGVTEAWSRMGLRALSYAIPGLAIGSLAIIALRRRNRAAR